MLEDERLGRGRRRRPDSDVPRQGRQGDADFEQRIARHRRVWLIDGRQDARFDRRRPGVKNDSILQPVIWENRMRATALGTCWPCSQAQTS